MSLFIIPFVSSLVYRIEFFSFLVSVLSCCIMEYVEVLKDTLIKKITWKKIKEIELTCFADIYSLVEDAAGNWRPDKLKRDNFAGGLLSERMKKKGFSEFI